MTLLTHLVPGILLGVALNRCGLCGMRRVRHALAFRDFRPLRCILAALGLGMLLSALLMWLAVIDVDEVRVLPLHGGTLVGGVIAGLALGLTGVTPGISLASIGSGGAVYGLCGFFGCIAGAAAFRLLDAFVEPVRNLLPASEMTLFATTLDHPFLLDGGFLALACLGAAMLTIAFLLPRRKMEPAAEQPAEIIPPAGTPAPASLLEDAFVAALPEEEPIVIDTAADAPTEPDEELPEDDEESIRELSLLDGLPPDDAL